MTHAKQVFCLMNKLFIKKHNTSIYIFLILAIAFLLRVIYYFYISNQAGFSHLILDPQFNDYWAHKILYSGNFPSPTGEDPMIEKTPYGRPPGYPFLLAFIYFLFGDNYYSPRVIQFFVGILNVYLIFFFASKIFHDKKIGLISALFMAILWEPIYFEGEINYPVWALTLTITLVGISLLYLQREKTKWAFFMGLLLGLFALFRPNALLLFPIYLILIFIKVRTSGLKKIAAHFALFVIPLLIVIVPVFIRNYLVSHEFFLISCFGGVNTYIGNNPKSTGDSPNIPDIINLCGVDNWDCFNYRLLVKGLGIKQEGRPYSFSEASHFFYQKACNFWIHEPISAIKLTIRKFLLFWGPPIVSDGKVICYDRDSSILRILPGFPIILGLSLFSFILVISKRKNISSELKLSVLFLFIWCFTYSFSVIPFFVSERYRVPIIPPLCMMGGIGFSVYVNHFEKQNALQKFKMAIICLLCFVVIYLIPVRYNPEKARWFYHQAIVSYKSQKVNDAIYNAKRSIETDPKYYEAYTLLGIISLEQKELKESENYYLKSLSINPDYAMATNNLGYVMELQGQLDLSEKYYKKACELSPVYSLAWINLGRIYLYHLENFEQAKNCFLKSTELEPNSWAAWFHLGNVFVQTQKYDLAEQSFQKSLSLNPENPYILNNLGFLFIQKQQYPEAINYLKKSLEIEPDFVDAMFNMANALKATGKIEEAKVWYKKVLEKNPDFEEAKNEINQLNIQENDRQKNNNK